MFANLSWKPKWTLQNICDLFSVCLFKCPSKLIFLYISFSRIAESISTTVDIKHTYVKTIQDSSNEGSLSTRDYSDIMKNTLTTSSETRGTVSTELGTKHPWAKGIQFRSNERPCPFLWRDNSDKMNFFCNWQPLKSFSQKPLGQFQPNLTQSILCWR